MLGHPVTSDASMIRQCTFEFEDIWVQAIKGVSIECQRIKVELVEVPIAEHEVNEPYYTLKGPSCLLQIGPQNDRDIGMTIAEVSGIGLNQTQRYPVRSFHENELR